MKKLLYGIDFGTTNSALSVFDEEQKEVITTIIIPSLIYFPAGLSSSSASEYVVGERAVEEYLKDGMQGRFIKSVKQILSRSTFSETRIHNRRYNASDLVAIIISELKKRADLLMGQVCQKAVIGRPVFFDDDDQQRDTLAQSRLSKAAELAGLREVRFQFEPIGAAFAYERALKKKERVLVADLGGGTTDFTFLTLDPDRKDRSDRQKDVLATGGIYIGGDSFDSSFMWERGTPYFGKNVQYQGTSGKVLTVPMSLFAHICTWDKMNFFNSLRVRKDIEDYYYFSGNNPKFRNLITLIDNNLGYSLFREIEKTKIALSQTDNARFQYANMGIEIGEDVSLEEYNGIIEKDVRRIDDYLERFLTENAIKKEAIDGLFLTGGSSLVPAVGALFKKKFPQVRLHSGDNFISVAKGLAYSGYLFEH